MNTKGNQRYINTKNKIKYVFLQLLDGKELEKITVSEICANAKIHRTTFYGHYEDVNALMHDLVIEMYHQVIEYFVEEKEQDSKDGFLKLFELVKSQQNFFHYYFSHNSYMRQTEVILPEVLYSKLNVLMERLQYKTMEELNYHQIFFCAGLMSVMDHWITTGCKETPEEMREIIAKEYSLDKITIMR